MTGPWLRRKFSLSIVAPTAWRARERGWGRRDGGGAGYVGVLYTAGVTQL